MKKITGALGGLGKVAGGLALGGLGLATAGVGALGAALVSGIGDARQAAQVMAATENVIKSMGRTGQISADQISEMAASLSAAEGMSLFGDDDIQSGQNMLLTFANINEVLPEATQAMVDMTQFMGGDMVGASTMLGKALDNPTQGLSALSRVGVSFSEQQKEQIKVMQAAGDMAGAQGVILDALKSQFGGAALAAAQADGGWAQFRDRMGEIGESVGAKLLPTLNLIPQALNSPEVQAAIGGFASGLATGVGGAISWVVTTGVPLLTTGLSTIATAINDWVITPAKNVVAAFNEWKAFGTEWGIVAALQAIGTSFPLVQPFTDWLATKVPDFVENIRLLGEKVDEIIGGSLIETFINAGVALGVPIDTMVELVGRVQSAVTDFKVFITDQVIPRLNDLYANLREQAPIAWATFKNSIQTDVLPILQAVVRELNKQSNEDLPATESKWVWFGGRLAQILNSAQAVASGWGQDIRAITLATIEDVKFMAGQWDTTLIRWEANLNARVAAVATWFKGLQTDITLSIEAIKLLFTSGWDTAMTSIQGVFITIGSYISGPIITAKNAVETAIRAITGAIQGAINLVNSLINLINSIPSVNIPSIPSIGGGLRGGGGSGFGSNSIGGGALLSGPSGASYSITVDARGASNPRDVEEAGYRGAKRALKEAGVSADLRLRTT